MCILLLAMVVLAIELYMSFYSFTFISKQPRFFNFKRVELAVNSVDILKRVLYLTATWVLT